MAFSGDPDCDLTDGSNCGRLAVGYFHSNVSASYGAFHVLEKSGNAWHPVGADNVMASNSSTWRDLTVLSLFLAGTGS